MKQLLQNLKSGETTLEEIPVPTPTKGMVLVRNIASAVSVGTEKMLVDFAEKSLVNKARSRPDLVKQVITKIQREGVVPTVNAAFTKLDQPMPLGYSSAGVITGLGQGVQGLQIGQRVACAGGGYAVHAEFIIVPEMLVTPIPDNVDFESAAFTTLGAIALHGFRLSKGVIGENIAIIGLGLLGQLTGQIALAAGCKVFGIDLDEDRVVLARNLGIISELRQDVAERAKAFTVGKGFDAVLICAATDSSDPIHLAGEIARDKGNVVAVGAVSLDIPRKLYFEKELTFINSRSYGPGRYDLSYEENNIDYPYGYVRWTEGRNFKAVIDLMSNKQLQIKPLITHRIKFEDAVNAYEMIKGKTPEKFLGIVLEYDHEKDERETNDEIGRIPAVEPSSNVRVGVIGAGNFANATMFPAMQKVPDIAFIHVASSSGVKASNAKKKYGFIRASSEFDKVVNDKQVNTIVLLTQHDTHAEHVIESLNAGKHVFCEKPLAITEDQLSEVEIAIERARTILTVGFNRRFAPFSTKLKDFVLGTGEPLMIDYRINAGYLPVQHWLHDLDKGGGRLIGEGIHFIDFLLFLTDEIPVEVSAFKLPDKGQYLEDNFHLVFTFPSGSIGKVTYLANGNKSHPKERVEVFSGGRIAILDDYRELKLISENSKKSFKSRLKQDKGHIEEWKVFVNAIQKGGELPIPYQHLIGGMKSAFSALKSLRDGKPVIIS